jgi:hypothetical protein
MACGSHEPGSDLTNDSAVADTPVPTVTMNEFMPGNASTGLPTTIAGTPDWIELVNFGTTPVPASEIVLSNEDGDTWSGPDDLVLEPGVPLIIVATDTPPSVGPWTGWKINRDDDVLTLSAVGGQLLETTTFSDIGTDLSFARFPDITGDLSLTARPTPGVLNGAAPSATLNPATESVFTTQTIHQIAFTFPLSTYQLLSDVERPEVHAQVNIDGMQYDDVGLKLKGGFSYDDMDGKPSFVVDFNQWAPGTKFRGLKAIKLHNGTCDPTRVRDHITYKLAREAGLMAPRVGWTEVFVNIEDIEGNLDPLYYGIYILIEKHDDKMIAITYPESEETGIIFEPNEGEVEGAVWENDFAVSGTIDWDYETGPMPITEGSLDHLFEVNRIIGGPANADTVEELWGHMNKERFLTYMAWETVASHTDGYKYPNNWRVYVDGVTGLLELLPAGAEMTWDFDVAPWTFGGTAAEWCLQSDACKRPYAEKILEVADLVESLDLLSEFGDLSDWLDPVIHMDPRYDPALHAQIGTIRSGTIDSLQCHPDEARQAVYDEFPSLQP